MIKFIELTSEESAAKILLNVDAIRSVEPAEEEDGATITFHDGDILEVTESYKAVFKELL